MEKTRTDIIFSLYKRVSFIKEYPLYIIFIFDDTGYWSNFPYIMSLKYQNSVTNIISVKNCITHYLTNLLRRFIFTRETNTRTTPDDNLYITVIHAFFIKKHFIRTKTLILVKRKKENEKQNKNKARLAVPQNIRAKCLG